MDLALIRAVVKIRFAILCIIFPVAGFAQDHFWTIGFFGGYAVQDSMLGVPIHNGPAVGGLTRMTWKQRYQLNLAYQWFQTEQGSGDAAHFQSFRLIPGFEVWKWKDHHLGIETGIGYQLANLENMDKFRQVEWIVGPFYALNVWKQLDLEVKFHYVRQFYSSSWQSQQFATLLGISYRFPQTNSASARPRFDADQDGVKDDQDECGSTPFGIKVSKNGCPIDTDKDSIADQNDFCPQTGNSVEVDELGCPLENPGRGILDDIEFESGGPRLTRESKNCLFEVAENLKKFPNLFFVIESYSSAAGADIDSTGLSVARAATIVNILISYGIPSHQIKGIGLGNQYPLVNANDSTQVLNERIEIKWKSAF